jgi:hypothetical protein
MLLGAYRVPEYMRKRYQKRLPLLDRAVPFQEGKGLRRVWRTVLVAAGDLVFCLSFSALVILTLYVYNDGAFRILVPFLALGGFALFRLVSVRLFEKAVAYLAYLLAALRLYFLALLRLPSFSVSR